jgi:hypothetical protein
MLLNDRQIIEITKIEYFIFDLRKYGCINMNIA